MSDQPQHILPTAIESEEAILGAMMKSSAALDTVRDLGLVREDFYRPSHRLVWDALLAVDLKGNEGDQLLVINHLKSVGTLTEAGGAAAILTLEQRCPAAANAKAYAQDVIDHARLRGLVEAGHGVARLGYERPDEPAALVQTAIEQVSALDVVRGGDDYANVDQVLIRLFDEWVERADGGIQIAGLPSGLPNLDRVTGGWRPGKFILIAGRPGMGKSAFAMQCAAHVAAEGLGTAAVFSMEMDPDEILSRLVSAAALVNGRRLTQSHPEADDWDRLHAGAAEIRGYQQRLKIAYTPSLNPGLLRSRCRKLKRTLAGSAYPLALVVVDYLQLMNAGQRFDNATQALSHITRALKNLAMELGVPVLVASQLNREVEKRPDRRPQLSDLRDSGSIEQDADQVLLAYRPEYYFPEDLDVRGLAIIDVAKNRGGSTDRVALGWDGEHTRLTPEQWRSYRVGLDSPHRAPRVVA